MCDEHTHTPLFPLNILSNVHNLVYEYLLFSDSVGHIRLYRDEENRLDVKIYAKDVPENNVILTIQI